MGEARAMYEVGWFAVVASDAVRDGRALALRRFGHDLVAWRKADGSPVLLDDRCPHRGASLALGTVEDGTVRCPFHGFAFDDEGACRHMPCEPDRSPPAAMRVRSWPVREAHGLIWTWPHPSEPHGDPPWFEELEGLSWRGFESSWAAHYSRAIENQLDMLHLPFVHATSIGRFSTEETLPRTRQEGTRIEMAPESAPEDGPNLIVFEAPNIWINRISDAFFIFVAFAPVDDDHTVMILRSYLRMPEIPLVTGFVLRLLNLSNRWILGQDQGVVESQLPRIPEAGGEVLVKGDGPIAAYRRVRRRLTAPGSSSP